MKRILTLVVVFALLFAGGPQAALVDRGGGLIYDTVLNVTWLQDANYAETTRYDADGAMRWTQAKLWAETLVYNDSVRGVTWTDWRLPKTLPVNGESYNYSFTNIGATDVGNRISAPGSAYPGSIGSEMAYMYYTNLGNTAYQDISGEMPSPSWVFSNTGPFNYLQADVYWSETGYGNTAANAWCFDFYFGYQGDQIKEGTYGYAWAVRDGDVGAAPVPIPGAVWLLGSGFLGLIGLKSIRRKIA